MTAIRSGKSQRRTMPRVGAAPKRFAVENVNHPGHVNLVDTDMCKVMKRALLKDIPSTIAGADGRRDGTASVCAPAQEAISGRCQVGLVGQNRSA